MDGGNIDLVTRWNELWGAFTAAAGGATMTKVLGYFGVGLIVVSLITFIYQRSRNKPAPGKTLMWPIGLGIILAAPGFLIPMLLGALEFLFSFLGSAASSVVT